MSVDQEPIRSTIRRIRTAAVLATTFRTFGRAPIFFLTLTAIQLVPAQPILWPLGWSEGAHWYSGTVPVAIDQILLDLVQAALLDRALRLTTQRKAPWRETLRPGWRRALPVLLVSLLQLFLGALGFALLVIPGFFVTAALLPAGPICLEGASPVRSLAQAWRMTRGARLALAGAVFVLWLPYVAVVFGIALYSGIRGDMMPWAIYVISAITVISSAWTSVLGAAAYRLLQPDEERTELADVFA